jgi:predicted O-linked N-acetylglucosamine transferase (SPINDLY family)
MAAVTISQAFDLAVVQHRAGRLPEAETLYRQILSLQSEHVGALHMLGVLCNQLGRNEAAVDLIVRAVALNPSDPTAHSNLGAVLRDLGRLDQAIAACRQAVALDPQNAASHNNLGNVLNDLGQCEEAVACYLRALEIRPNYWQALHNMGTALRNAGQFEQAITAHRQALTMDGGFAGAYVELSAALSDMGRLEEAEAACRQAISLQPDAWRAWINLGGILLQLGRLDEAADCHRQAMKLKPDSASAHSSLISGLHYNPRYDARAIAQEQRKWAVRHEEPLKRFIRPHHNDRDRHRRLRIGYVSPDFRDHVVGRNVLPLMRHHNREQFEITCYAQVWHRDAMTLAFQQATHRWRNIVGASDHDVAAMIREDGIDLLIDLALHTAHNRLQVFALKPAPVQMTWAGYPGNTGLSTIDYRVSDPYLDPPEADESLYTEKTLRLPDSFWCYDPHEGRAVPVSPLPALSRGTVTFGSLNNFCKVNADVLNLWAQVLRQVEGSRLILLARTGSCRQRTLEVLTRAGVREDRIQFVDVLPRRHYFELYHQIDIGLDTFPYNGHTTSLDSLWMGVPIVTLAGKTVVSRAGLSQHSNLGLAGFVTHTSKEFVRTAISWAADLPRLAELRTLLRPKMLQSPLMDAPRFAGNMEALYRQTWQTWCGSLSKAPPDNHL